MDNDTGEEGDQSRQQVGAQLVRDALVADTDEVIRLAAAMYEAMGIDASSDVWRNMAADQLHGRLGGDVKVAVVEDRVHPGRLAAAGAGVITTRLPGPINPSGLVGYVQWVSTDPSWRRRGLARAITVTLLDWFALEQVPSVELHATARAEPLYRALGFDQGLNPGLRLRLDPR